MTAERTRFRWHI